MVEGDGSLLMGFSALATVGHLKPRNLVVVVLDNGVYLATGGQPTAARDVDLVGVARACGWADARDVESTKRTPDARRWRGRPRRDGPILLRVPVGTTQPKNGLLPRGPGGPRPRVHGLAPQEAEPT